MRSFRFVHLGIAAMLAAATATVVGVAGQLSAAPGDVSSIVPIVPCRLFDTRASDTVGTRATPIGKGEEATFAVWGTNGKCTIPSTATGIVANVTTVNGTDNSFLTVFPSDATRPLTSNLNWIVGSPPTPNQVGVPLSATGAIKVYNHEGSVDVILDIVGYLVLAAGGAQGPPGPPGSPGAPGAPGTPVTPGADGTDATISSGNWGVILRNTIGSPDVELRGGPHEVVPVASSPPFGSGSLMFSVSVGSAGLLDEDKASYGNEVDFLGDPVAGLTKIGFYVFTTGENNAIAANMPGITLEIDPNLNATASNFSSLVFEPTANSPANQWSDYIDATLGTSGLWFLTGAAGSATNCTLATPCTFAAIQTALNDGGDGATILTVAVSKGRDDPWHGAIDGLTINNQVFDFEESGVFTIDTA